VADPVPSRSRALLTILGVLTSAGTIAFVVRKAGTADVRGALEGAVFWPWVPLGVAFYALGMLIRGLRCRILVSPDTPLGLLDATSVVLLGYAANNVLPARLGELVRAGMLAERGAVPVVQALAITLLERILDAFVILGLTAIAGALVGPSALVTNVLSIGGVIIGIGGLGFVALALLPRFFISLTSRLSMVLLPSAHDRAVRFVAAAMNGAAAFRHPASAVQVVVLSILVWLSESGLFYFVLGSVGLGLHYDWALLALGVTNLGILAPSAPGYMGTFHYFCMSALTSVGVDNGVALSYAVLVHLAFFIPVTIAGGIVMLVYGVGMSRTLALLEVARKAPPLQSPELGPVIAVLDRPTVSEDPPLPSDFTLALCEAIAHPAIDRAGTRRSEVLTDVGRFVEAQLEALPTQLRIAFEIAMRGFRWLVAARTFQTFCALDPQRRASIVAWCSFGPIAILRKLFRPVRSLVVLALFDHPALSIAVERPRRTSDVGA
jgi:glycosyltransferase 2 family protein